MVYVVCSKCGNRTRLDGERGADDYICPICVGTPNQPVVPGDPPLYVSSSTDQSAEATSRRRTFEFGPLNIYLICDQREIIARWQNDERGWMLRHKDGFVRVNHVHGDIPPYGNFVLVEIAFVRRPGQTQLSQVAAYQLEPNLSLQKLVKSDTAILSAIVRTATLSTRQKDLVKQIVQANYLRSVWKEIDSLLDIRS